jgi:hypothetical protein
MSGGSLNYFYSSLEEHVGDFGDKELDELVSDLAELFHDREWYLSSDTGVGQWNEARDAFKAKWFKEGARKERIERYLSEFSEEIRKMFGISDRYCKTCKHWSTETKYDETYSRCDFEKNSLNHRSESCNKWEPKEGV